MSQPRIGEEEQCWPEVANTRVKSKKDEAEKGYGLDSEKYILFNGPRCCDRTNKYSQEELGCKNVGKIRLTIYYTECDHRKNPFKLVANVTTEKPFNTVNTVLEP